MRVVNMIVLMFLLTQVLGIYVGSVLIENAKIVPEFKEFNVSPTQEPDNPLNALFFLGYVLVGAGMVLLLAKYYKGMLLFQLIEACVIFGSSSIVFYALIYQFFHTGILMTMLYSALLALALVLAKNYLGGFKNVAAVVSSAGVGAIFGFSFGFIPALLTCLLISAYDYVAVFKTRHMVTLAKELSTRQLSFTVTAKKVPARREKETDVQYVARAQKEGERLDLGTGDLAVPLMLAVSAYGLGGALPSLAVAAGSTIALAIMLKFVYEKKVFLPAMPPICLGGVLGLLIFKLAGF